MMIDSGPLISLLNKNDPNHERILSFGANIENEPLITTCFCFTEVMHFLGKSGGFSAQSKLWGLWNAGLLGIHHTNDEELKRMEIMMNRYSDLPMDVADASLIAAAETLKVYRIFTLDRHFHAYRAGNGDAFEVVQPSL